MLIYQLGNRFFTPRTTHADLKRKIEEMEAKYDNQFQIVFEAIKQLA